MIYIQEHGIIENTNFKDHLMPTQTIVVEITEILQHAVSMDKNYAWNQICGLDAFKDLYPQDGASLTYIENDGYGEDKDGNPTTWLDYMEDPIMKDVLYSFMEKHNLLHVEWAIST